MNHICALEKQKSKLDKRLGFIQVSAKNPWTRCYFRSLESIEKERSRIAKMKLSYIIHPFSIFRMYWGMMICVLYYISLYTIPVRVMFGETIKLGFFVNKFSDTLGTLEIVFDFFNLADIFVDFLTGYHTKHFVEMRPQEIAKNNFKGLKFYLDFICGLPIQPLANSFTFSRKFFTDETYIIRLIKFSSLVKILRLYTIRLYFQYCSYLMRYHAILRNSLKYLLELCILLHWLTCLYIIILEFNQIDANFGDYEIYVVDSMDHVLIYDYWTIYWKAMYVVVSYLLNIDLEMGNQESYSGLDVSIKEMLLFILYSVFGYVVFSYLFVCIFQMMKVMNSSKIKYHSIKAQLIEYLSYKRCPPNIKRRILSYYEYRYRKKYYRESLILDMLSDTLRRDINLFSCRALVASVSVLKELPPETIGDVVSYLKREVFLYNDIIIKAGAAGDCMYFIARGTVAVTTLTGKEICHLQDGAYFGEIALLSPEQIRVANVIAIEICEVYRLDKRNFHTCFMENSNSFKNMVRISKERKHKTRLLEELHKKYIVDKIMKHRAGVSDK